MTQFSAEVDPFIAERIAAIRDRFGTGGLRAAIDMATAEIAIFEDEAASITDDGTLPAP
jgi:hypothetical protein